MLQAAGEVSDGFADGVFWIPLAPLRDESAVAAAIAQALDVGERPGVTLEDSIVASFESKRALIVADNCEHLLAGVTELVRQIVEGCPTLVVVASSRERLGLRAERVYDVPPLAPSDALELFVERASAVDSGFRVDEHAAAICEAVDELPLPIELAAARVRSLSTAAIRERLTERLALLSSASRDVADRQRTLEATIAWSYDLLNGEEQQALRSLSVFAGGCTLSAAQAVAGADLRLVESLLDKSLIRRRIDEAGHDRYWMLETIREYALRELERDGEASAAGERHTEFFVRSAADVMSPVGVPTSDERRDRFLADRANFREAHARALAAGDARSALRLVRCLGRVSNMTGTPTTESFDSGLASVALDGGEEEDRAYALVRTASFADQLGKFERARDLLSEAERMFETLGDARGLADAIGWRTDVEYRSARLLGRPSTRRGSPESAPSSTTPTSPPGPTSCSVQRCSAVRWSTAIAKPPNGVVSWSRLSCDRRRRTARRYTEPTCSGLSPQACSPSRSTRNRSRPSSTRCPRWSRGRGEPRQTSSSSWLSPCVGIAILTVASRWSPPPFG
jgi:predicted ATPase